jgi:hypothetical protein
MTRPARIPRDVVVAKRQPDPRRNSTHLNFIRSLPCCTCGCAPRSEAAHIRAGTDGGIGMKPSDRHTVPMCTECHRHQHTIGELAYWSRHGIDPTGLAEHLWTKSGDLSAGTRAVLRMVVDMMQRRGALTDNGDRNGT